MECITKRKTINAKRKELLEYIKKNPNKLIHMDKSDLEELLFETNYALGFDSNAIGGIVNASRSLMCAYKSDLWKEKFEEKDYAKATRAEAIRMRDELKKSLQKEEK